MSRGLAAMLPSFSLNKNSGSLSNYRVMVITDAAKIIHHPRIRCSRGNGRLALRLQNPRLGSRCLCNSGTFVRVRRRGSRIRS